MPRTRPGLQPSVRDAAGRRPAIPSNAVSVADCGGSGGDDAGTDYAMTLSVTAGVLSPNITGLSTSWAAGDSTWTATDDTGAAR